MGENQKPESFWQTVPGILTAIAAIITAGTGLIVALYQAGVFHHATEQSAASTHRSNAACSISGQVFDSDSSRPLAAIRINLFRDMSAVQQRPVRLRSAVATSGPDGKFRFNCDFVKESEFPVLLAVSHADWVAERITGPQIPHIGEWNDLNVAVPMSSADLKPLREVTVSFGSTQSGADWFLNGVIENKSSRSFPCIRARFHLSTSYQDKLRGEPDRDLGFIDVEVRDLGPNEKRPYEKKVPKQVGIGWDSTQECQ